VRIGLVTDYYYPWIAGPSAVVRALGRGLASRGHNVSLIAPSPDGAPGRETEGPFDVWRVRTVRAPVGYNLRVAVWPRGPVGEWLEAFRPDVIHVHHPFAISASAIFVSRRRQIPVVATNHTIPECSLWGIRAVPGLYPAARVTFAAWLRYLLERCDSVATPTESAAEALRALGYRREVVAISNGVDTQRFAPGPPDPRLREALGLDARPVVLYTGRLDAEKQMDVWLRAAQEVAYVHDVQFLVGGRGTDDSRLRALAERVGLARRLHFMGYLDDSVYPAVYRLADVYCITSPVELQSISTLEAVASGLPVVAVRAGALPELVLDGENGYCVEPGNHQETARAIMILLRDDDKRVQMGRRSRAVALGHEVDRCVEAYESLLMAAAASGRGGRRIERSAAPGW
jgi:glycosyltransferase involved in cell wall biosynthesis